MKSLGALGGALVLVVLGFPSPVVAAATDAEDEGDRLSFSAGEAEIPAFARKYKVSCNLCHMPFPKLTEFGENFAGNGFQFAVDEPPRDTIDTGDPMLRLAQDLPLAIRFEGFGQIRTDTEGEEVSNDLQFPWGIKLLTGGVLAKNVSWYMYFFLSERGEVAGLEDAFLQFTDVWGSGVNLVAGQFQVSDPLFKRELRLEFEDYAVYRVRVGDARADLTYDRGLMAGISPWEGGDLVFGIVNGTGIGQGSETRQYDTDTGKNTFFRLSHSFGPLRIGGYAYFGDEKADGVRDRIWILGPDASLQLGELWELNATWLHREDENPFFVEPEPAENTKVDGWMGELLWWPEGRNGRWTLSALYNRVDADEPVFSLRLGELANETGLIDRYEVAALGASWLFWRNLRFTGEAGWDFGRDAARFTAGVVTAF